MKKTLRLLFILCCLAFQRQLLANSIVVKGTVKDSANNPVANKTVRIYSTDSTSGGCALSHSVVTNANGYYIDTLSCSGAIRKLMIFVESCNATISHDATVGTAASIEINFTICVAQPVPPAPGSCKAVFSYTSTTAGIKFASAASAAVSGDSIISRSWLFGDSTTASTGDPLHLFHAPGSYNVCLTIKTRKGCESNYCAAVVVPRDSTPVSSSCKAVAVFAVKDSVVTFNSAGSAGTNGTDSIISRNWNFGDSATLTGNTATPSHNYKKPGTYNATLTIKTKNGCESHVSLVIVIAAPIPASCKAAFTYTVKDSTVYFNSGNAAGSSAADSITSRSWNFGDSSTGNTADPSHYYKKPGSYNVTLTIKTKNGCESHVSLVVVIAAPPVPTSCKAVFTYTVRDSIAYFNSGNAAGSSSTDSITSRSWNFGDSSTGNTIDPSHSYKKPGSYNVTLTIKTKNGCESKVTVTVVIAAPVVPAGCKALFTYTVKDSTVYFNSSNSVGTSPADSIISRSWTYTDSSLNAALGGNTISPSYKYAKPGTYTAVLAIKTKNGCESHYSAQVVIPAPPPPSACKASFTYSIQNNVAIFNSQGSKGTTAADSIMSRIWLFGDNTTTLQGGTVAPAHTYAKSGRYTVMLYIKTQAGCESKYTDTISIAPKVCSVVADFSAEKVSLKKLLFNSSQSRTIAGDSIVLRNWSFGDTTTLSGNIISPVKEYAKAGLFTACLQVKTASGCEAQTCKLVAVLDTVATPQSTVEYVKIVSINPNPVTTRLLATIFNRNTNTEAEISIYDIYGTVKFTVKKLLSQGNNQVEINTSLLYHGEYFLKVTTRNGSDSKAFYKF